MSAALTTEQLRDAHGGHASAADRLTDAEQAEQRPATPDWRVVNDALQLDAG